MLLCNDGEGDARPVDAGDGMGRWDDWDWGDVTALAVITEVISRERGTGPRATVDGGWNVGRGMDGSVNLDFPRAGRGPSMRRSAVGGGRRGIVGRGIDYEVLGKGYCTFQRT